LQKKTHDARVVNNKSTPKGGSLLYYSYPDFVLPSSRTGGSIDVGITWER
jgi:hypothetical protein